MEMDPNAVAEQRANEVAKLRRAASLPRMKDGRRPPMHGEQGGVSEGEPISSTTTPEATELKSEVDIADKLQENISNSEKEKDSVETKTVEKVADDAKDTKDDEPPMTPVEPPAKRRSRSRSRSRGSKDLKAKIKALGASSANVTVIRPK